MPHYLATEEIRHRFARPWGTLVPVVDGDKNLTAQKVYTQIKEKSGNSAPTIITIGDVVTDTFCQAGIPIQIAIIDGKTKRGFYSGKTCAFDHFKSVENPAGEITEQAWNTIKEVLTTKEKTLISINGEEDLLVVPMALEAEKNVYILYGQPPKTDAEPPVPEGVVYLEVTAQTKKKVKDMLSKFVTT